MRRTYLSTGSLLQPFVLEFVPVVDVTVFDDDDAVTLLSVVVEMAAAAWAAVVVDDDDDGDDEVDDGDKEFDEELANSEELGSHPSKYLLINDFL